MGQPRTLKSLHDFFCIPDVEIHQIHKDIRFHGLQLGNKIGVFVPIQEPALYSMPRRGILIRLRQLPGDGNGIITGIHQHGDQVGSDMTRRANDDSFHTNTVFLSYPALTAGAFLHGRDLCRRNRPEASPKAAAVRTG